MNSFFPSPFLTCLNFLCSPQDSFRETDAFVEHTCTDFGMEKKKVRLTTTVVVWH